MVILKQIVEMKKILFLSAFVLFAASCRHDVVYEADYNVTLDKENTYYAGEPVKFNFTGNVDNLLFFSGESGHVYQYKDRYCVKVSDLREVSLKIDYEGQWGYTGGLSVYYSNSFAGLKGSGNAETDRATIEQMIGYTSDYDEKDRTQLEAAVDEAMAGNGWTKLQYDEGGNKEKTSQTYEIPLEKFDNISLAFHFHPKRDDKSAQRSYLVTGNFLLGLEGLDPMSMSFKNMQFVSYMMNKEIADPYQINKGKGSVNFNNVNCDIFFQGHDKGALSYALDGWVISDPMQFTEVPVDPDKGAVIKNLQNYLHSYEYTWNEPGTYKVTFVGRNENYASASELVREFTITVLPKE